ncbi:MAG: FtsW/RodA/SpoVE family cell cycle protein [Coriobacteriales bacterium]|jgi:cell division protein FtsW|nr:FtsW/RodA/SpoVE family cell cycle protein [Coriobacteriales bacterium]
MNGNSSVNWAVIARVTVIVVSVILLSYGIYMLYSSSSVVAESQKTSSLEIVGKQLAVVAAGVFAVVVLRIVPYKIWRTKALWVFWAVVVAALVLTLILGQSELGATRFIPVPYVGSLMPSEFLKIVYILISAHIVVKLYETPLKPGSIGRGTAWAQAARSRRARAQGVRPRRATAFVHSSLGKLRNLWERHHKTYLLCLASLLVPGVLVYIQPDLGTLVIALAGVMAVICLAKPPPQVVIIGIVIIVLLIVVAIATSPWRQDRIDIIGNPNDVSSDLKRQSINSMYALAEGGLFGVGPGKSRQKTGYLPQPSNDYIFPIIGEELGFLGASLVALLFLVFMIAGLVVARNAPDLYGRMIAGSASVLIGGQAFLNMLCTLDVLPLTGKPLPFFSQGGSSILATLVLVGLILAVSFQTDTRSTAEKQRDAWVILKGGAGPQTARARVGSSGGAADASSREGRGGTTRARKGQPVPSPQAAQTPVPPSDVERRQQRGGSSLSLSSLSDRRTSIPRQEHLAAGFSAKAPRQAPEDVSRQGSGKPRADRRTKGRD